MRIAAALVLLGAAALPARAERLVLSLSSHEISIGSNYTGTQLVAFGLIERDAQTIARGSGLDLIITVRGPRESITVRRKEPFGPVWLNRGQQKFVAVPAVLGVFSSRPVETITTETLRRRLRLGIEAIVHAPEFTFDRGDEPDPYRDALIRLKMRDGLWTVRGRAVSFITPDFFRAPLPLPATAPTGNYDVEAMLLADGLVLARRQASFEVVKSGFEERITDLSQNRGLFYGLATAAMALLFGWIASMIFRRD